MLKPGSNNAPDPVTLVDESQLVRLWVYPVDMTLSLKLAQVKGGVENIPDIIGTQMDAPISNTQNALALWNKYGSDGQESLRAAFLVQARRLVEFEQLIGEDAGGWPLDFPLASPHAGRHYLSALVQGQALSVLARAYILTRDTTYLEVARRAVRTFERDILDGGVCTPMAGNGLFFEQWAVYPAAHTLEGMVFALLGLHDFLALVDDADISTLIQCSHATMHKLLGEFDPGFWTYSDLLHRRLASPSQLALQITLLEALAHTSGCNHCSRAASHWKRYQRRVSSRLHYLLASRWSDFSRTILGRVRTALFPRSEPSTLIPVCISVPAFPVMGGVLTVLEGVAQVTKYLWEMEYLTYQTGPSPERYVIHQFGNPITAYWQFPAVWLYVLAGCHKFLSLMHRGANYRVILPQDCVFTAAFSALAARLAGVRVVCIDHGHLTLLKSRAYRAERMLALATKKWPRRLLSRLLYIGYWPSFYLLAWIAARFVDQYLVPGIAGDGVEERCRDLGVPASRITRFASMIDVDKHVVPDAASRADMREKKGIAADAIVVAIICRLAPEKGLEIAIESISQALSVLSPAQRARVRVIIAGDGPLRKEIEADIQRRGLNQTCVLWGDISAAEVISLLGISDIFLYTSTRGACFAMSILEAMASSCAVIASTRPISNAYLLAEGRGIAVPSEDVAQTSLALVQLINDPKLCCEMGCLARDHIKVHHSPVTFKRTLMREIGWSGLDEMLAAGRKAETVVGQVEEHQCHS